MLLRTMASSWTLRFVIANLALAVGVVASPAHSWKDGKFKTLVTFGDSFTDETRLNYFGRNNGSAPPVGWEQPWGLSTASGGLSWARYASIYSNTTLYNYAVSGAVCSNQVTPRYFASIRALFPDLASYAIPAFIADSKYRLPNATPFFTGTPDSTVYAIWIGTNDLGNNAFLTDSQVKGKTVVDYVDCVYDQIKRLYENGGRYFVLLNIAPLDLFPQYSLPENGGLNATQYFPEKARLNSTEVSERMRETVASLNALYKYRTPYETSLYPPSNSSQPINIATFNVHALMTDIHLNPSSYLNGTAPLNVTSVVHPCDLSGRNCTTSSSPDSFEFFDTLHPSEQTGRVVAREFVRVLGGGSRWAEYWGGR